MLDVTQGELSTLLRADPEATSECDQAAAIARGLVLPGRHSLHVDQPANLLEALSRSAV